MDLVALFNEIPFHDLLGIEMTAAEGGAATAELDYDDRLLSNPHGDVLHGGATYALADAAGGAAVISLTHRVAPTVDMRLDYLAPATTDLRAEADVVRHGDSLAMVRVEIFGTEGEHVATGHGTYKTGGGGEDTPWADGTQVAADAGVDPPAGGQ
jgi:uncharacterized protein (TIGR00369 family)